MGGTGATDMAGKLKMSNATKEIPDGNFYNFRNPQQRLDGDDFLATFDFSKIFWIQIHRFSQLLLGEAGLFTIGTNGIANYFSMPQNRLFLWVGHDQRLPIPAYGLHQQHAGIFIAPLFRNC